MVPVPLADEIYDQSDKVPPNSNKETISSHNWESKLCTVDRLMDHELHEETSTVKFVVKWVNGTMTKEPEWILQKDIPTLIYEYWERNGGRGEKTGFTSDHVFRILGVDDETKKYRVQWDARQCSFKDLKKDNLRSLRRRADFEYKEVPGMGCAKLAFRAAINDLQARRVIDFARHEADALRRLMKEEDEENRDNLALKDNVDWTAGLVTVA
ncbi:hypothetical protein FMUND_11045 [Fusarium mundagurra]|uniref:Chromo domain-containing protein n=1 Tax=Fusarium mundagurra TaxID=1567541 RepID=A0A8H5Y8C4_9HYPO|nr:hypothetical protein FMUND_11045 [Fusarium mundagurra]